jgi:hypothetical protein
MARIAVYEWGHPHPCPWCKGRGAAEIEGKIITCDGCGGAGFRPPTEHEKAQVLNIEDHWKEWRPKYFRMLDKLNAWECEALGALIDELAGALT